MIRRAADTTLTPPVQVRLPESLVKTASLGAYVQPQSYILAVETLRQGLQHLLLAIGKPCYGLAALVLLFHSLITLPPP